MIQALDAEQRAERAGGRNAVSERSCAVTRAVLSPDDLIRFVAAPDGTLTPDIARKLPGRGVWVSCHKDIVDAAVKTRAFQRSLRRKVDVASDLSSQVDALLSRRVLELLSLCNKAGVVTAGSSKVNSWLEAGAFGALVQAKDASPDGLAKVSGKYRAIREATGRPPIEVTLLTISELSLAFGRANVVHAALSEGKAAANVLAAISRLEKFRAAEFEVPTLMGSSGSLEQAPLNRNTG